MARQRHRKNKLLREYSDLAQQYDLRWASYLQGSLDLTTEVTDGLPADDVLDVACGTGLLLERFAKRSATSKLAGIDVVPAMLEVAAARLGERAHLACASAADLPYPDNSFQLVTSSNALHYFDRPDRALREMRRVLDSQGNLVITDWCRDFFWMKMLDVVLPHTQHAHGRTFHLEQLQQSLKEAGFATTYTARNKIDWFWGLMTVHATPV